MKNLIDRRTFIKTGIAAGGATLLWPGSPLAAKGAPDIAVAKGTDAYKATIKAIEKLGGMSRFVKRGGRVAVLANAQRNNPGVYTHPELIRGVVRMCRDAGAADVHFLTWLTENNWESTGQKAAIEAEGAKLILCGREDNFFRPLPIPKGVALTEAALLEEYFKYDTFINMPITKDHAGNRFTGTMKNLMGINSPQSNRSRFHKPDWTKNPDAIRHLDQCIADLNLVVPNHLCVVDATEFITTDGPFGPGKLLAPGKVVAGTDRVAIDAYCCSLFGLVPSEIHAIAMAFAHGLGQIDLKLVKIKEYRS